MTSWADFKEQAPELSARAERLLKSHVHQVLGTLRKDGFPRLSGTEIRFANGELYWGAMPRSRKAQDLIRDPRFSLHSGTADPPEWQSDVKVTGLAVLASDGEREAAYPEFEEEFSLFKADIQEVALVAVKDEQLIIELFHHRRGLKEMQGS